MLHVFNVETSLFITLTLQLHIIYLSSSTFLPNAALYSKPNAIYNLQTICCDVISIQPVVATHKAIRNVNRSTGARWIITPKRLAACETYLIVNICMLYLILKCSGFGRLASVCLIVGLLM